MTTVKGCLVAGEWRTSGGDHLEVRSPYDGTVVAKVARPTEQDISDALDAARVIFAESRKLPVHRRADALVRMSRALEQRAEEIASLIAREGGKPIKWARIEAARAAATFRWAAEECRRDPGDLMRLDADPATGSRLGLIRRFPIGPVLGITPFNFPVNLVAHKMAPALAVGAPIVVKPATATPLGALLLGELFLETDLPPQMCSVLALGGDKAGKLVADDRFAKISFTGSSDVGWSIKAKAPKKKVTLELGGNAGVIVHSDADLDKAAARVAFGGYYQAGQSCIAVQRVFVHEDVAQQFTGKLVSEVGKLKTGDPMDPDTDVGPLIDHKALDRISQWVDEAVQGGAEVLTGGKREDPFYAPTVLSRTRPEMRVRCEEIFGPVTTIETYARFADAIEEVNATRYGLQAGVFTRDLQRLMLAHRDLEVGGVIANDVSAVRADQMPYGGMKDSGSGREGLRYAMDEMTESKILVLSDVPL